MKTDNPFAPPSTSNSLPKAGRSWLPVWLVFIVAGLTIGFIGILYGAIMVNIPNQDATPEQLQLQARHGLITGWIMMTGGFLAMIGMLFTVVAIVRRLPGLRTTAGTANEQP